ncbi:MAG: hypothetical protein LQ338_007165 [Usnochroma carphineum]|nr:MAG: hypothetical protein LQ338_007165 [Usnochroma carphineum]
MPVRPLSQRLAIAISLLLLISSVAWLSPRIGAFSWIPDVYTGSRQPIAPGGPQSCFECDSFNNHPCVNKRPSNPLSTFAALLDALDVMQSHFYTIWQGQWPDAIDWTAAVMGTHVSATLAAMTEAYRYHTRASHLRDNIGEGQAHENIINRYFTQITSFYFGENAFSLRTQAYDDMLWVVLDWLESIKFINMHTNLHYTASDEPYTSAKTGSLNATGWYAQQFVPQFAHRARLFYDLAAKGWDTSLCGGGMVWNPYLSPYKNAITNQLFISASISMYLHFPGDDNPSPFSFRNPVRSSTGLQPAKPHDPQYLEHAVEAYQWLKTSGMRNWKGLYADGFHISGWKGGANGSIGTGRCDLRNEQVYTYNQGVILSGLKGLWEATGSESYLEDGHELIRNVVAATGWDTRGTRWRWQWSGLGRNGVMEEACDSRGTCSQNGHTFKGIFFHHLTLFCSKLPSTGFSDGAFNTYGADDRLAAWHEELCESYGLWLRNNAQAAYLTRDNESEFGTWWGIPAGNERTNGQRIMTDEDGFELPPDHGTDYRNEDVPLDDIWRLPDDQRWQELEAMDDTGLLRSAEKSRIAKDLPDHISWDPNDRGRGRTVETQSGGLAVLRALWKVVDSRT